MDRWWAVWNLTYWWVVPRMDWWWAVWNLTYWWVVPRMGWWWAGPRPWKRTWSLSPHSPPAAHCASCGTIHLNQQLRNVVWKTKIRIQSYFHGSGSNRTSMDPDPILLPWIRPDPSILREQTKMFKNKFKPVWGRIWSTEYNIFDQQIFSLIVLRQDRIQVRNLDLKFVGSDRIRSRNYSFFFISKVHCPKNNLDFHI